MKALRIEEYGSVEVLEWKDTPEPTPSPHQVLIKVDAAGVNYADIMRRQGNYPGPDLPATLGLEAAGTITALGSDVTDGRLAVGQKVMAMGRRARRSTLRSITISFFRTPRASTRSTPAVCR